MTYSAMGMAGPDSAFPKEGTMEDEKEKEQEAQKTDAESASYDDDEQKEGQQGGEPAAGQEVRPEEEAPEGHDEWLKHFEHAAKTHPLVYGMVQHYADQMAEGQEGQQAEKSPEEKEAEEAEKALSGGQEKMPDPTGDDAAEAKPYGLLPGSSLEEGVAKVGRKAAGGLGGSALGGLAGLGVGGLLGHPGAGAAIGAGLGGGAGALSMNDNQIPVEYAAAFQAVASEIGTLKNQVSKLRNERSKDQKEIAKLSKTASEKDAQVLMYQFTKAGVKEVSTREGYERVYKHLLALPQADRAKKAAEIMAYWAKDEALVYEDRGAPVGDFLPVSDISGESRKAEFDNSKLEVALNYMRKTRKPWQECVAYAMNETVVNG